MPRPDKVQAVEEISERLQSATATFVTEYRGLSVVQLQELRTKLRESGGSYKVYKMSLARLAAEKAGAGELNEWLGGPTAIAFADDDPVAVAKTLSEFAEQNELFVIKGGMLSGEVIAPEVVAKLASIDSREVLLAKIAGAAKAPLVKMAGMMASFTRDAASMFSQLLESKEADAPEPVADTPEPVVDAPEDTSDPEPDPTPDEAVEDEEVGAPPADEAVEPPDQQRDTATDSPSSEATESEATTPVEDSDPEDSGTEESDAAQIEPAAKVDETQDSTDDENAEGDTDGSEEE